MRVGRCQQFHQHRQPARILVDLFHQACIADIPVIQVLVGFFERKWFQLQKADHPGQFCPALLQVIPPADHKSQAEGQVIAVFEAQQVEQPIGEHLAGALEHIEHQHQSGFLAHLVEELHKQGG